MQIKKGPYGYYAIEKIDDPDRLCDYAEEIIAGNHSDFYLTPSTEQFGAGLMCCYEFSGYMQVNDREFSVFSSPGKTGTNKKEAKNLILRRRSAGDLFYSFIKLMDNLISPSLLVLDPDMIFTDPEGIDIKLCCLPLKSTPDDLCLSALGASRLELLLNTDFFKNVITEDERNALVFSVKENNESLFLKTVEVIRKPDGEESTPGTSAASASLTQKLKLSHGSVNPGKTEKDLILSCASALIALILLIVKMYFPCFLFFCLSAVIFSSVLKNRKKNEEKLKKAESEEKSKQRSSILFTDADQKPDPAFSQGDNKSESSSLQGTARNIYKPLRSGQLNLISEAKGVNRQYSVYLDETCIGSDCFLSDIVIDDPNIAPLHAVIKQSDGAFYLLPSKGSGKTYIEDSPVENGRSYEIKSGQKITVGDIDFRFCTADRIKNEY